jgi:hypothetical protein
MTLRIMGSITTLSISIGVIMLFVEFPFVMSSVAMLSVVMMNVVMLSVIMLNVVMLGVLAPLKDVKLVITSVSYKQKCLQLPHTLRASLAEDSHTLLDLGRH